MGYSTHLAILGHWLMGLDTLRCSTLTEGEGARAGPGMLIESSASCHVRCRTRWCCDEAWRATRDKRLQREAKLEESVSREMKAIATGRYELRDEGRAFLDRYCPGTLKG